ncbi:hypothetical protein KTR66_19330 [Roseococcus sp. SDR]|uniref:hypothetical protein n=1 Tax=Roseococcus sp. SDR TaxID=2835532 RepID=UPI001BCC8291|nr:hypothetical protein [Roseococcus sp. SDR]MBS7792160.1 hypothetical protein [Roseococcus sp. SDR]MBV1847474.1 hypothetical protein [Roseococcus sp. SDR]
MSAAEWLWPVWVGANLPYTFTISDALGARVDLTGITLALRIEWPGGQISMQSGAGNGLVIENQADPVTRGQFTVTLSLEQSRALPTALRARYGIEHREGGLQFPIMVGEIAATQWVNSDE